MQLPDGVDPEKASRAASRLAYQAATPQAANRTFDKVWNSLPLAREVHRFVREGGYEGLRGTSINPTAEVRMANSTDGSRERVAVEMCHDMRDWAYRLVDGAMANSPAEITSSLWLAGLYVFENTQPRHECYWNNRFCLAVMLNLPWELQQKAAWCSVNNGLIGYWEWLTHSGYRTTQTLERLHIQVPRAASIKALEGEYAYLDSETASDIVQYFDLPSRMFGPPGFKLDEKAKEWQESLWEGYNAFPNDPGNKEHKLY